MENIKDSQNKGNLQKGFNLVTVLVLNKFTLEKVISLSYNVYIVYFLPSGTFCGQHMQL